MIPEKTTFLRILNAYIHNEKANIDEICDLSLMEHYAKIHQVEALFYVTTKNQIFKNAYYQQIYISMKIEQLFRQIQNAFIGLDFFIVKGIEFAKYYPDPLLRSMGDLDIVIRKSQLADAHQRLVVSGFDNLKQGEREWIYYKDGIMVELHTALVYSEKFGHTQMIGFFNDFWKYYKEGRLDTNFHFLFAVFHILKHIMTSGIGFRQFYDVAILSQRASLDWKWIQETAQSIGISSFLNRVLIAIQSWFDVVTPISPTLTDESFINIVTQHIFQDGIFGFNNSSNIQNHAVNIRRNFGIEGYVIWLFQWTFKPLKYMQQVPEMHFLCNKPYLLPYAWIKRLALRLHGSMKRKYMINKQTIKLRNEYLGQWGL